MVRFLSFSRICVLALSTLLIVSCSQPERDVYYTWEGFGPDKWASAWFIQRFVSPNADIVVMPAGTGTAQMGDSQNTFDFPEATYKRTEQTTTFAHLLQATQTQDDNAKRLVDIVYDIEVNFWGTPSDPMADIVESGFRQLQRNKDAEPVPMACYFAFFDNVYNYISNNLMPQSPSELLPSYRCYLEEKIGTAIADAKFVPELSVSDVAQAIAKGERVTFIDVREPEEFAENHIPGALNVQLRRINELNASDYADDALVVAYCVKDFRGFEMAKALRMKGFNNAVILNPYGIKGWVHEGMPVASKDGLSDEQGIALIKRCPQGHCEMSLGGAK
ncbi:chromate resistance protein [Aestuariibacter sp. AA17]|uniref:Chromate resistance protein n=1 Tax=Fluctibacter corallii TaxID=2984329 RepID=A0ABT3ACG5_9ALTE|nr:chromate resistance protein ChrB domain-containing protein [Aestuariibacter sp. AA17]MCV2886364.1 chromate resistance protein [Aestuariibacter sp. AA17]